MSLMRVNESVRPRKTYDWILKLGKKSIMKPETMPSSSFDRPKLLLFRFLAHQIHPFAYAVNTFLQPALDDCRALLRSNPQDTFSILLSLTQTFIRFAPDAELIYDDIQQFAGKLKDSIDECFAWLDPDTIQQSAQLLEAIHQGLSAIIQQQNNDNTTYTNIYKNMSAVLTNLQKINSLPVEVEAMSLNADFDATIPVQKTENEEAGRTTTSNGPAEFHKHNGYSNGYRSAVPQETTTQLDLPLPSVINQTRPLPQLIPNPILPATATSVTTRLMNHMKTLTVTAAPASTTTGATLASAIQSLAAPRPPSTASFLNDYEITDSATPLPRQSMGAIAAFPPRQLSAATETVDYDGSTSLSLPLLSKTSVIPAEDNAPTPSFEDAFPCATPPTMHDDGWSMEKSRQYYLHPCFTDREIAGACWEPVRHELSVIVEKSHLNHKTAIMTAHVTDEYMQAFGDKQNRPALRGDLCMTYGAPQSGPQTTCLPIGIGLSYDELTLLSCDVHRSAQNVRLFDIRTGQLKHTITSTQQMKLHRPSAVMSNARDQILIVERERIYVTEPDGRLIQTIGHSTIKQLYGIALFRDQYLLTIESKATDGETAENSRLLLFDPNSGQLVFEQHIVINKGSDKILEQQNINRIQGRILSETRSKPRFLAVHNDQIYIADLGRSLIYGTSIRNQFDFSCTTVFGGHGRANGEMTDPAGLVVDSGGNVISADSKNNRIQIFSSDGEYQTALQLNERIKRPSGICTNRAGTQLYASCYLAGCVRAFNISY